MSTSTRRGFVGAGSKRTWLSIFSASSSSLASSGGEPGGRFRKNCFAAPPASSKGLRFAAARLPPSSVNVPARRESDRLATSKSTRSFSPIRLRVAAVNAMLGSLRPKAHH